MEDAGQIKRALRSQPHSTAIQPTDLLSTGSTLLNLACTGDPNGGFVKGRYHFVVGDTASGKTFLSLTCLAEAARNSAFDNYRFIYDDVEGGALMDIRRFFGSRVADRLEPPAMDDGQPKYSGTTEEFYFHADDALSGKRPCIYVLDSQDSLSSDAEVEKFDQRKKAHRAGKEVAGTYGDNKAKLHSSNLRKLMGPLRDTGSILIVVNQTRDSFDMFQKSSYSGGRALLFYAALELWSSVKGHIERTIKGKKRELGIFSKVRVKKNRLTGRDRTVVVPIYHSHGIDDAGSCVDWLVEEGFWKDVNGVVEATGMGPTVKMKREQLIRKIEVEEQEQDLRDLVGTVWGDIERACSVKRKMRYE